MIPLIEETVAKHGWLTESQFYNLIGVCESTPGPIAVNMATYIGSTQGGILGSAAATCGVVLPSFLIILLIASVMKNFTDNPYFKGFMKGVKPVIIALILSTGTVLLAKAVGYVSLREFRMDFVSVTVFVLLSAVYFSVGFFRKKKISRMMLMLKFHILILKVNLVALNYCLMLVVLLVVCI
jgi:chromate transporter